MTDIYQNHFKMDMCNGSCGARVHVANNDDLEYWRAESKRTNHKMVFDYSIPEGHYMNTRGVAYDVYDILPLDYEVKNG